MLQHQAESLEKRAEERRGRDGGGRSRMKLEQTVMTGEGRERERERERERHGYCKGRGREERTARVQRGKQGVGEGRDLAAFAPGESKREAASVELKNVELEREVSEVKDESNRLDEKSRQFETMVSEVKASHAKDLATMLLRMEALEAAVAGSTRQ